MDNSSESPEKASNPRHNSNLVVEDREYLAANNRAAANLETSVGEVVSPKSTLKRLFGTGKASQVSLKREVLVRGYRLDWSRIQKELQGSKNFCG
jgi:hypothetical protein